MKLPVEGQAKLVQKWIGEKVEKAGQIAKATFSVIENWWKVIWPYAKHMVLYVLKKPAILMLIIKWMFINDDCEEPAMA